MDNMRKQSLIHGTQIITKNISKVDFSSKPLKLWAEGEENNCILSKTVIIATGASANRLRVKGEETYWQQGISACAICDGALPYFRNKGKNIRKLLVLRGFAFLVGCLFGV